ncbi:uncharacterized protein LOC122723471 [Manihot esculenta]|uniref:uncharacterized protein LOC122723471 n=1 Tax=Manihot esculenta TaxID=3983 RepID=UPI001CC6B5EB|nr:uncharacterized protein LOC122723471 [Manihot esculenta]
MATLIIIMIIELIRVQMVQFIGAQKERDHSRDLIVSFDLSNEVIKTTALPDAFSSHFWRTILLLEMSMLLLSLSTNHHVELWVLLEYGVDESWTKLFTVAYPECLEMSLPLGFSRRASLFFSSWNQHLLVWNPPEETISPVPLRRAVHTSNYLQAVPYMESHTSLKGCNKLEDEQKFRRCSSMLKLLNFIRALVLLVINYN